jgi:hypothetical protein
VVEVKKIKTIADWSKYGKKIIAAERVGSA